jgi:hypothetical protein
MLLVTTPVFVMFILFIVPAMPPFHIHPAISLHIIRTASVAQDIYVWRCRLVVTDAETRVRGAYLQRNRGIGLIQAEKDGECSQCQYGINKLFTHNGSLFNWYLF